MAREFFVYILSSRSRVLYVGITSNLAERISAHREGRGSEFVRRYRVHRVVHVESFPTARTAIAREKEIKAWRREKKERVIVAANPTWAELLPDSSITTANGA